MNKYQKPKLSTVTVVCISVILLGLTLTLSYTSINAIKFLGKHSIELDTKSTRDNAKLFFLEITRRTAGAYSTYLSGVEDFVNIISTQTKELLTGNIKNMRTKDDLIKFQKYKDYGFYVQSGEKRYHCFYFGDEKGLPAADSQIDNLVSVSSLLKTIFDENTFYFVCLWIQTASRIHLEYPGYYNYKNINGNSMRKYFENIFSEYLTVKDNLSSNIIWSKPYKDISGKINLDAYKFIFTDDGEFLASVGIDLNFDKLVNTMTNNSLFSDKHSALSDNIKSSYNNMEGFIFIVDKDGSIIVFPDEYSDLLSLPGIGYSKLKEYPDKLTVNLNESLNPNVQNLAEKIKNNEIDVNTVSLKRDNYIIAHKSIPATGWVLCFATLEKSLMTSVEETRMLMNYTKDKMIKRFIIISLIFLIFFIILTALFFRFYLLKPLSKLLEKVKKMGKGHFDISLSETGFAEIADLSITFNSLSRQLKDYTKNLEKEVKQRQSIETELEIAGKLQDSVLPKITDEFVNDKFELYAKLIPAREMSGDFYDFFYVRHDTLCVVLADVCGKGITAAFYMSMAKAIIKEACLKSDSQDTGKIVKKINEILINTVKKKPMFLTMYLLFYNIDTGKIIYTNAGHHVYAGVDCRGNVSFKGDAHNSFVGFFDNIEYSCSEIELKPGEIIALYTDGITETCNKNDDLYGDERLGEMFESTYKENLSDIGDFIFEDVSQFQSGDKNDDITLVMLKRK